MVFYRKYRPQSLEELIGQSNVKQTLEKAFLENKLAHAYLFCGPRGTGKTSTARILAKMVNCEKNSQDSSLKTHDSIPCNQCSQCLSITDGSNLDLIEIDAASNRGIDDIRTLRENIKLAPSSSSKKVYIIDEVHMLSTEAFNALLKTLEEPPAHVIFILATTEENKIPVTILSRVQKLDFKLANPADVLEDLKKIVTTENLQIDEDALLLIAKKSEGSFRDAEKLLDQVSSLEPPITLSLVENAFKSAKFENILSLLNTLVEKNTPKALEILQNENNQGINIKEYLLNLIENLRHIFLIKNGVDSEVKKDLSVERYENLKSLSEKISLGDLNKLISSFQEASEKMKYSVLPIFPLEIAVVEFCLNSLQIVDQEPKKAEIITTIETTSAKVEELANDQVVSNDSTTNEQRPTTNDLAILQDKWTYILETVKPMNFSLEALLRSVKLASCEDCIVTLEVPYSFHQRILEAPKNRDLLESILTDVLGVPVRVATIINKPVVTEEELANVEVAADDEIIRIASEIFNAEPLIPAESPSH